MSCIAAVTCVSMVTWEVECVSRVCLMSCLLCPLPVFALGCSSRVILINGRFTECRLLPVFMVASLEAFCFPLDFAQMVFGCR